MLIFSDSHSIDFFKYLIKAMIPQSIFITYLAIISIFPMSEASRNTVGFTIDLIHRDSPQSPTYDPSLSPSQRLANSIQRSHSRLCRFTTISNKQSPVAEITGHAGEYLMSFLIGTPPVPSIGIADTGSDTVWTQCANCTACIKQKLPIFNPKKSHTYKTVPCKSRPCNIISDGTCDSSNKKCLFSEFYGDGSSSDGDLATDTLILGSTRARTMSFPNFVFGCGYSNTGLFSGIESGIVGLGGGKGSLVSQLGSSIKGKFAYCLVSYQSNTTNSSKLHFGNSAKVSGRGVVSTPLVTKFPETYYSVTLEGISVGHHKLEIIELGFSNDSRPDRIEGNIFIDSGTTVTFIPDDLYNKVEKTLKRVVKLKRIPDPTRQLKLCWFTKTDNRIPVITMHFRGADVKLNKENAFFRTSRDSFCFSFASAGSPVGIYGNWAQTNFLVGYDLQNKKVSFKPKDCTKY